MTHPTLLPASGADRYLPMFLVNEPDALEVSRHAAFAANCRGDEDVGRLLRGTRKMVSDAFDDVGADRRAPRRPPAPSRSCRWAELVERRIERLADVDDDLLPGAPVPRRRPGHCRTRAPRPRCPRPDGAPDFLDRRAAAESLGQVVALDLIAADDLDGVAAGDANEPNGPGHVPAPIRVMLLMRPPFFLRHHRRQRRRGRSGASDYTLLRTEQGHAEGHDGAGRVRAGRRAGRDASSSGQSVR